MPTICRNSRILPERAYTPLNSHILIIPHQWSLSHLKTVLPYRNIALSNFKQASLNFTLICWSFLNRILCQKYTHVGVGILNYTQSILVHTLYITNCLFLPFCLPICISVSQLAKILVYILVCVIIEWKKHIFMLFSSVTMEKRLNI